MKNANSAAINFFLLFATAIIWGSQFALIDISLDAMSSIAVATLRTTIGATCLMFLMWVLPKQWVGGTELPTEWSKQKLWTVLIFIGLFEAVFPACLLTWGQTQVESGIAAIIIGSIPFFTYLFSVLVFKSDKISFLSLFGVLIGFAGLLILIMPELQGSFYDSIGGELAILLAAMSFACSVNLIGKLPKMSPILAMRNSLGVAAAIMIVLSLALQIDYDITFSREGMLSVIALGVFCTGIVYFFFIILIQRAGPSFASMVNYFMPLIGCAIGVLLLDEQFSPNVWYALGLTLAALFIFKAGHKRAM